MNGTINGHNFHEKMSENAIEQEAEKQLQISNRSPTRSNPKRAKASSSLLGGKGGGVTDSMDVARLQVAVGHVRREQVAMGDKVERIGKQLASLQSVLEAVATRVGVSDAAPAATTWPVAAPAAAVAAPAPFPPAHSSLLRQFREEVATKQEFRC